MAMTSLHDRLHQLDEQIKAWDRWTDKHPYPSGMEKLRRLRAEYDQVANMLNVSTGEELEEQDMPPEPFTTKLPPPPIKWEADLNTRESSSLWSAALDVVRRVIHGDSDR